MEAADLRFLTSLIYIIPTYTLHACLFYTIFFSVACNKFSGSFYAIFGLSTVYYVFYSIFYYIDLRFGKTPFLIPFVKTWGIRGFMVTFFHLMPWYFVSAAHLFNFLLAFNRLTVFTLKVGYQKFWDKYLKYFLAIPICFPFLLVWHIPFTDIYVQLEYETDLESTRYTTEGKANAVPWMDNPRNFAILISVTSTLSFIMNIYVIIKLMQQKYCFSSTTTNGQHGKVSTQDVKMSIYTLFIFITDVINCIFLYLLMTAKDFEYILWMLDIQVYLIDITTLTPAWFVLATNTKLRKLIAGYFGLKKIIQSENSVSIVGTTAPTPSRQQQLSQTNNHK